MLMTLTVNSDNTQNAAKQAKALVIAQGFTRAQVITIAPTLMPEVDDAFAMMAAARSFTVTVEATRGFGG